MAFFFFFWAGNSPLNRSLGVLSGFYLSLFCVSFPALSTSVSDSELRGQLPVLRLLLGQPHMSRICCSLTHRLVCHFPATFIHLSPTRQNKKSLTCLPDKGDTTVTKAISREEAYPLHSRSAGPCFLQMRETQLHSLWGWGLCSGSPLVLSGYKYSIT